MEQSSQKPRAEAHQAAIKVTGGSFAWSAEADPVLHGVDLEVLEGQLLMVVGEVGCGKSSLLSALLGEMNVLTGSASVSGGSTFLHGVLGGV